MNHKKTDEVNALDQKGLHKEAWELLNTLASRKDPMALFELSCRYYSTEGVWPEVFEIEPDPYKSKDYAKKGKEELEKLSNQNDAEAMRMLGYLCFGFLCPYYKDRSKAEYWLLKSIDNEGHVSANDLATFYQNNDIEKAKYWYKYADDHGCRVIYNPKLEE